MDIMMKLGWVFKSCGFKEVDKKGMVARFNLPIIKADRLLPSLSKVSFLNKYPSRIEGKKQKVAIFIGCLANYNYTEIGDSLVEVLKELDIEIIIPKEQKCCAAPAILQETSILLRLLQSKILSILRAFLMR